MSDATRGSLLNRPVQRRSVPCATSRQIPFAASDHRGQCGDDELAVPSGPGGSNDKHRQREGRSGSGVFPISGRGEQPVTSNRTGTDFTQEDLGAG